MWSACGQWVQALRGHLWSGSNQPREYTLIRDLAQWVRSVCVAEPQRIHVSLRSRNAFSSCARYLSKRTRLAQAERRPWAPWSADELLDAVEQQLSGKRCRKYTFGPCGWSGDDYKSTATFDADFAGVRSDALQPFRMLKSVLEEKAGSPVGQCRSGLRRLRCRDVLFAVRHELQHEIQRCRDGLSDKVAAASLLRRFKVELEAMLASAAFLRELRFLRNYDATYSIPALVVLAGFCAPCSWYEKGTVFLSLATITSVAALLLACTVGAETASGLLGVLAPLPLAWCLVRKVLE